MFSAWSFLQKYKKSNIPLGVLSFSPSLTQEHELMRICLFCILIVLIPTFLNAEDYYCIDTYNKFLTKVENDASRVELSGKKPRQSTIQWIIDLREDPKKYQRVSVFLERSGLYSFATNSDIANSYQGQCTSEILKKYCKDMIGTHVGSAGAIVDCRGGLLPFSKDNTQNNKENTQSNKKRMYKNKNGVWVN